MPICSIPNVKGLVWAAQAFAPGKVPGRNLKCRQTSSWSTSKIELYTQVESSTGRSEAESKASGRVGTRSTSARTHGKHLLSLDQSSAGSMFLTSKEKQSSSFQKRRKRPAATPSFGRLHPSSVLDLHQILSEKKAPALSKVLHYKICREMFTLEQPAQKRTFRRINLPEKLI